jgi:DnaD/phage-associated family protein
VFVFRRIMSDYWAKIYIEIIDDPKMATMPDRLWRRTIELFLLAKKINKDGHLPDTKQLAWVLRMSTDELDLDLKQIALTGIIQVEPSGWFVVHFEKRQAASTPQERMAQMRKREQHQQYYQDVTQQLPNVTQRTENRLTEAENRLTETEAETEVRPLVFSMYEHEIGIISPMVADALKQAEKDYPLEWFIDAFKESVNHNARSWKYVEAILKRWKTQGRKEIVENKNGKQDYSGPITLADGTVTMARPKL